MPNDPNLIELALREYLRQGPAGAGGQGYMPPQPGPGPQFPVGMNAGIDTQRRRGLPAVSGGLEVPLLGGNVGLSGSYQPDPRSPEYAAMLRYGRGF